MPNEPLLSPEAADQALRDLMPLIEALSSGNAAEYDGYGLIAEREFEEAKRLFREFDPTSPAIAAYLTWLEQNTARPEAKSGPAHV